MDETARKFDEAIAWLKQQDALTDDVRAAFAQKLPWVPHSCQDAMLALVKPARPAAPRRGYAVT